MSGVPVGVCVYIKMSPCSASINVYDAGAFAKQKSQSFGTKAQHRANSGDDPHHVEPFELQLAVHVHSLEGICMDTMSP